MAAINFGISSYSRHAPGAPLKERLMDIPDSGKLKGMPSGVNYIYENNSKPVRFCIYSHIKDDKHTRLPVIQFGLAARNPETNDISEIYLIWLEKRNEWIAVNHHMWNEAGGYIDECESGPYAADDYCRDMISIAYSVDKGKLGGDISKMSPSELERIAMQK